MFQTLVVVFTSSYDLTVKTSERGGREKSPKWDLQSSTVAVWLKAATLPKFVFN